MSEIPVIKQFKDDLWPYEGYDHVRYTARALARNEEGKFAFLHIVGEDFFGKRNHLETIGGGMEEGEFIDDTMVREIKEESGYEVRDMVLIGAIIDTYNLIHRITYSTFFLVDLDTTRCFETHKTEEEEILIKEIVWLDPLEALERLEREDGSRCDRIVQRRDAFALRYYLENATDLLDKKEEKEKD